MILHFVFAASVAQGTLNSFSSDVLDALDVVLDTLTVRLNYFDEFINRDGVFVRRSPVTWPQDTEGPAVETFCKYATTAAPCVSYRSLYSPRYFEVWTIPSEHCDQDDFNAYVTVMGSGSIYVREPVLCSSPEYTYDLDAAIVQQRRSTLETEYTTVFYPTDSLEDLLPAGSTDLCDLSTTDYPVFGYGTSGTNAVFVYNVDDPAKLTASEVTIDSSQPELQDFTLCADLPPSLLRERFQTENSGLQWGKTFPGGLFSKDFDAVQACDSASTVTPFCDVDSKTCYSTASATRIECTHTPFTFYDPFDASDGYFRETSIDGIKGLYVFQTTTGMTASEAARLSINGYDCCTSVITEANDEILCIQPEGDTCNVVYTSSSADPLRRFIQEQSQSTWDASFRQTVTRPLSDLSVLLDYAESAGPIIITTGTSWIHLSPQTQPVCENSFSNFRCCVLSADDNSQLCTNSIECTQATFSARLNQDLQWLDENNIAATDFQNSDPTLCEPSIYENDLPPSIISNAYHIPDGGNDDPTKDITLYSVDLFNSFKGNDPTMCFADNRIIAWLESNDDFVYISKLIYSRPTSSTDTADQYAVRFGITTVREGDCTGNMLSDPFKLIALSAELTTASIVYTGVTIGASILESETPCKFAFENFRCCTTVVSTQLTAICDDRDSANCPAATYCSTFNPYTYDIPIGTLEFGQNTDATFKYVKLATQDQYDAVVGTGDICKLDLPIYFGLKTVDGETYLITDLSSGDLTSVKAALNPDAEWQTTETCSLQMFTALSTTATPKAHWWHLDQKQTFLEGNGNLCRSATPSVRWCTSSHCEETPDFDDDAVYCSRPSHGSFFCPALGRVNKNQVTLGGITQEAFYFECADNTDRCSLAVSGHRCCFNSPTNGNHIGCFRDSMCSATTRCPRVDTRALARGLLEYEHTVENFFWRNCYQALDQTGLHCHANLMVDDTDLIETALQANGPTQSIEFELDPASQRVDCFDVIGPVVRLCPCSTGSEKCFSFETGQINIADEALELRIEMLRDNFLERLPQVETVDKDQLTDHRWYDLLLTHIQSGSPREIRIFSQIHTAFDGPNRVRRNVDTDDNCDADTELNLNNQDLTDLPADFDALLQTTAQLCECNNNNRPCYALAGDDGNDGNNRDGDGDGGNNGDGDGTNTGDSGSDSGPLSDGAIAGIVVGSIAGLAALAVGGPAILQAIAGSAAAAGVEVAETAPLNGGAALYV